MLTIGTLRAGAEILPSVLVSLLCSGATLSGSALGGFSLVSTEDLARHHWVLCMGGGSWAFSAAGSVSPCFWKGWNIPLAGVHTLKHLVYSFAHFVSREWASATCEHIECFVPMGLQEWGNYSNGKRMRKPPYTEQGSSGHYICKWQKAPSPEAEALMKNCEVCLLTSYLKRRDG